MTTNSNKKRFSIPSGIYILLIGYILYFLITGVFSFSIPKKVSSDYIQNTNITDFYGDEIGPDRGILIDNPLESGLARLKLIEHAEETLDIAYYSIDTGESPNIFFGALMEAADRGVQVNVLLDGMFHGLRGEFKPIIYAFTNHPNMNLRFYEPFNPFLPWTINNRMHDKYMIADKEMALIGGRNIGDKYFAPEWYTKKVTNDRDIAIVNTNSEDLSSVVYQMADYFKEIWDHPYTKPVDKGFSRLRAKKGLKTAQTLKNKAKLARETYKEAFTRPVDLMEISFPSNKMTLIRNPIERFSKEPWVWYELTNLMKSAEDSVFVQSPYVIPNKQMVKGFVGPEDLKTIPITLLTNSLASTPNLPAYSGYLNHRQQISTSGIRVLELQAEDSIHAKAFVVDDKLLSIGSFNLDPRSAYLSTESMVVINSPELVEHFGQNILDYTDESLLVLNDLSYKPQEGVEEARGSLIKATLIKSLSYITRWFEYLL